MDHPAARSIPCQTSVRPACRHPKLVATAVSPGPLRLARRSRVQTGPMTAQKKAEESERSRGASRGASREATRGASRGPSRAANAAPRDGRRPGRLRAPPAGRTLPVSAHGPGLPRRRELAARVRAPRRRPGARRPGRRPPARLAGQPARLRRGAHHPGPARLCGADVHRLRSPLRLAGRRPRPAARHPEDPPHPAPRAAPGRDADRAGHGQPRRARPPHPQPPDRPPHRHSPHRQPPRRPRPQPRLRSPCATLRSSNCSTRPASGSANCAP